MKSVQSALTADKGFENLQTKIISPKDGGVATFMVKKSADIKKKLEEIASSNSHVAGFEIQ